MINVQPYINKLEVLKEWIALKISNPTGSFWIDINAIPVKSSIEQIMRIYEQTGIIFAHSEPMPEPIYKDITFEEYFQSQNK